MVAEQRAQAEFRRLIDEYGTWVNPDDVVPWGWLPGTEGRWWGILPYASADNFHNSTPRVWIVYPKQMLHMSICVHPLIPGAYYCLGWDGALQVARWVLLDDRTLYDKGNKTPPRPYPLRPEPLFTNIERAQRRRQGFLVRLKDLT